jgi:hypothetical protein
VNPEGIANVVKEVLKFVWLPILVGWALSISESRKYPKGHKGWFWRGIGYGLALVAFWLVIGQIWRIVTGSEQALMDFPDDRRVCPCPRS